MTPEALIRATLLYDPETGRITRLRGHYSGYVPGSRQRSGYVKVKVGDARYFAHRVAWLLHYGEWPSEQIDHINGVRSDNRIANLRDVPQRGNQQNVTRRKDNGSGYLGVSFHRASGKWQAQIKHCGRKHYLGLYSSPSDAAQSYELAKLALHEFQPTERGVCHA